MNRGRPAASVGLLSQLDALARGALPTAATLALLVLAAVPVGLPGAVPAMALPCVFFWSVFRPGSLPPPAVFGLGLMQDLLSAAPIGSGVLTLLLVHGLATRWRRVLARRSFVVVWLAFSGFAAGAAVLGWMLHALLSLTLSSTAPGVHQVVIGTGLYPCLAYGLTRAHEAMRRAESAL